MQLEGVIKGYRANLSFELINSEKDTSHELWQRMGRAPFYSISMYDYYLGTYHTGYMEAEAFKKAMKDRWG